MIMDTVENAIRRTFRAPVTLHTFGWQKPFELSQIDNDGIVLLLGKGKTHAGLSWDCLETIPPFLQVQRGWVVAGGEHSLVGTPGTLDHHLKKCLGTDVARWLTRVLHDAGLVDVDEGPPLRLRLKASR